ncbi:hypothetical protein TRFO_42747 [Tritrichomonas foetus]|uniref:Uncharacterized protein n=1 Tax=Tritrichomonas foetus TaxID=1144522 RepID=A0A1J4KUT1_9EUKA|nr:hypothetical protein TRFO_42747 [Tritrichomonas foetus]|eukprot:OHT15049.1 hypothetical protein TRFO_42747 [Tritrichomonas foetus]
MSIELAINNVEELMKLYRISVSNFRQEKSRLYGDATRENMDKLFDNYNYKIFKYPMGNNVARNIYFYNKDKPDIIFESTVYEFYKEPTKKFKKAAPSTLKQILKVVENDKSKLNPKLVYEEQLKDSMKTENCELISEYIDYKTPVFYIFDGLEYKVAPYRWKNGNRPHKNKRTFHTPNHMKELIKREDCELITEYKTSKQFLTYKYKGVVNTVKGDHWLYLNERPHLQY